MAQLSSSRHRRLVAMDAVRSGVGNLHTWLEEEKRKGSFAGEVYGPLGMEIKVLNAASHADVIESVSEHGAVALSRPASAAPSRSCAPTAG